VLLTMALILPTSACLGAAFPFALSLADDRLHAAPGRFGLVYAVNTLGSVAGSLAAGFVFIPAFGIQPTLWIVSGALIACAIALILSGALAGTSRIVGYVTVAVAMVLVATSPPWDRELLASGVYMYAPYVPKDLDLETQLKAGDLLYYEEGAAATVSVKRLTGTTTLAVDGKTDASNRGDMLTQKLIAHLPLLLHGNPKEVGIIGLGSGVTLGAALSHPITPADVLEIPPEVGAWSDFFRPGNPHPPPGSRQSPHRSPHPSRRHRRPAAGRVRRSIHQCRSNLTTRPHHAAAAVLRGRAGIRRRRGPPD